MSPKEDDYENKNETEVRGEFSGCITKVSSEALDDTKGLETNAETSSKDESKAEFVGFPTNFNFNFSKKISKNIEITKTIPDEGDSVSTNSKNQNELFENSVDKFLKIFRSRDRIKKKVKENVKVNIRSETHSKNKIPFNIKNNSKINKYFTPTRVENLTPDEAQEGDGSIK